MLQRSPTYFVSRPQRERGRRHAARARHPRRSGRTRSSAARCSTSRRADRADVARVPGPGARRTARPRSGPQLPRRLRRRQALHARGTGRGSSASRSCPTATCSRRSAAARRRWSTDEIETFTEQRHPTAIGRADRRRHHRHRHRVRPERARRHPTSPSTDEPVDFADTVTYRGMMFTGVPEHGVGLRLLPRELDAAGRSARRLRVPAAAPHGRRRASRKVVPALRDGGRRHGRSVPWIDPENFNPGYLMRGVHLHAQAAATRPRWRHTQDYWREKDDAARSSTSTTAAWSTSDAGHGDVMTIRVGFLGTGFISRTHSWFLKHSTVRSSHRRRARPGGRSRPRPSPIGWVRRRSARTRSSTGSTPSS